MKTFLLILLLLACWAFGPGVVLIALVSIPLMLAEWLFNLLGVNSSLAAWVCIFWGFIICLFPFFYKKGM